MISCSRACKCLLGFVRDCERFCARVVSFFCVFKCMFVRSCVFLCLCTLVCVCAVVSVRVFMSN